MAICSGSIYFCILRKKWADDKKQVDFANKNIEMIMQGLLLTWIELSNETPLIHSKLSTLLINHKRSTYSIVCRFESYYLCSVIG